MKRDALVTVMSSVPSTRESGDSQQPAAAAPRAPTSASGLCGYVVMCTYPHKDTGHIHTLKEKKGARWNFT